VPELTEADEYLAKALLSLRTLADAQRGALGAFDALIENADPGFDPDAVAEFDERTIVMEHLGSIRRHIEDLVRMLAAQKGKHALGELVGRFDAVTAEREHVKASEPIACVRCGHFLGTPREGGAYTLDTDGPSCPDNLACDARRRRTVD
jgi:hypothetical protein